MLAKPYPTNWHEAHDFMTEHDLTIPLTEDIYDANGARRPNWVEIQLELQRDQDKHGASAGPEGAEAVEPNGYLRTGALKSVRTARCGTCKRAGNNKRVLKECR